VFNIVNEATRATVENPVRKVIASGRIVGLANHTVLIRKDGTELPIDDSAAPIMSGGRIEGVVLVFRDITEAKQSQAALMRSEKLASVGRLASTIAHEINNPLEAVSNLLYLLEQDPTMNAVSKERVESAVENDGISTVELCFADNGTGIDKADLKKIFEPFYTTKADVGTGLGLWLTKSIIGEHEGEVQVESDNTPGNSGTTFKVRLPGTIEAGHAAGEAVAD
jgi:signal transduction histidine kinase